MMPTYKVFVPKLLNLTVIKLPGHLQNILGKAEQANDLTNQTDLVKHPVRQLARHITPWLIPMWGGSWDSCRRHSWDNREMWMWIGYIIEFLLTWGVGDPYCEYLGIKRHDVCSDFQMVHKNESSLFSKWKREEDKASMAKCQLLYWGGEYAAVHSHIPPFFYSIFSQ